MGAYTNTLMPQRRVTYVSSWGHDSVDSTNAETTLWLDFKNRRSSWLPYSKRVIYVALER